jgi:ElaB/YqjD/DUF883 family membrane-anchored ribosome-binding protein
MIVYSSCFASPTCFFKFIDQEGGSMDTDTPKTVPIGAGGSNEGATANGSWNQSVDQAKTGAHGAIDKFAESARPAVDKLSASAHQAVDKLSGLAAQANTAFSGKMSLAKGGQEQLLEDTRAYVREKPGTALAIAVAAGFILSSLFRSR